MLGAYHWHRSRLAPRGSKVEVTLWEQRQRVSDRGVYSLWVGHQSHPSCGLWLSSLRSLLSRRGLFDRHVLAPTGSGSKYRPTILGLTRRRFHRAGSATWPDPFRSLPQSRGLHGRQAALYLSHCRHLNYGVAAREVFSYLSFRQQ